MTETSQFALAHGAGRIADEDLPPEIQKRVQQLVTMFNEQLSAALCSLADSGLPLKIILDLLVEHLAKTLTLAEPRAARKDLREHLIEQVTKRLAVAELQRFEFMGGKQVSGRA